MPPPKPLGEGPRMRHRYYFCARQFRRSLDWISEAGGHFALDSSALIMSAEVCFCVEVTSAPFLVQLKFLRDEKDSMHMNTEQGDFSTAALLARPVSPTKRGCWQGCQSAAGPWANGRSPYCASLPEQPRSAASSARKHRHAATVKPT